MLLPSVLLHDHLDGGLRPQTVLELAAELGYQDLPAPDLAGLEAWFDQSESGSLERYLEAFNHTIAVMQTYDAIERVAYEAAIDLSRDGVVYAELRFCPAQHTSMGMAPIEVIEAVSAGMRRGAGETGLEWGLIIDSLRHLHRADDMARLALSARNLGVVGFDIAGPEAGFPPGDHRAGFDLAARYGLGVTIHAGEAGGRHGVANMASAVDECHAQRLGHGVEIINDCEVESGEIAALGPVARRIRDRFIPLEMCPASNMATSRLEPDEHPFGALFRAGFNVTLSTDNRLMSSTSMSREYEFAMKHAHLTESDLLEVARRSLAASFTTSELRAQVWAEGVAPGFRAAGLRVPSAWVR